VGHHNGRRAGQGRSNVLRRGSLQGVAPRGLCAVLAPTGWSRALQVVVLGGQDGVVGPQQGQAARHLRGFHRGPEGWPRTSPGIGMCDAAIGAQTDPWRGWLVETDFAKLLHDRHCRASWPWTVVVFAGDEAALLAGAVSD
jgi:hypothetical protein